MKYISLVSVKLPLFILFLFGLGWQAFAQGNTIKGVVTDKDNGDPLIGANIIVEGTSMGVITDYNGEYLLYDVALDAKLIFSYIGYESITVDAKGRSIVDVQLKSTVSTLEQVMVFGESQKDTRTITSSVSKIDSKVFSQGTPSGSFDQLLQGQVAGLAIQTSGEPGETSQIRIRGNNSLGIRTQDDTEMASFNLANEPLYILNGNPITSDVFNTINPNDIIEINVLKDGLSTVAYGTRGANGVIEIKTKKGLSGKTQYNVRYQHTVRPIGGLGGISLMDAREKMALEKALNITNGAGYIYSPHPLDDELVLAYKERKYRELENTNTNWLKELSRVGQIKDLQISISGGSDDSRYFLSTNYYKEDGGYENSWAERFTTRLNVDNNITHNLTVGVDASIGRSKTSKSSTSPARLIYTLQPYETLETTDFVARKNNNGSVNFVDPFDELYNSYAENTTWRLSIDPKLTWTMGKGFSLFAGYGLTYNDGENDNVNLPNADAITTSDQLGRFSKNQSKFLSNRLNANMNYVKSLEKHFFSVSAGTEYIHNQNWGFGYSSVGISDKVDPSIGANPDATVSNSKYIDALLGFYGNFSYSFKNKYDFNASLRYDGSSILPSDKQFVTAWGAGAAWDMKAEPFLANNQVIDKLNLRFSYGLNYNSGGIRQTLGMPFYDFTNDDMYRGERMINLVEFYNPDLRFEKTKQWSAAVDFGLFDSRVYGTVEGYIKNTNDLLSTVSIPASNGYTDLLQNIGALQNRGIEFQLSTVNIRTSHFRWTSQFNLAYNINEITDLYGADEIKVGTEGYFKVGEPINSAYVKYWAGVNPANGSPMYYDENHNLVLGGVAPQMIGFGTYDHPLTGGFSNIFTIKNLEISTLFTFAFGGVNYNNLKATMIQNVKNGEVPFEGFLNEIWLAPGDVKMYPYPKFFTDTSVNSLFLEDASYIRWKNLIVRYNLSDYLKWIGTKCMITAQVNNVFTFTKYEGIDPEITGIGQPLLRSYTLGFDLTF
ncbi:SusC/RagA family TonB-linked outer membrane protein [Sediminitomix flava]|uniref:TonB-linked SusC/RagA family outer membrane protein n=1 Tax=Sediminitomix flava TaxID=379075 RepID=A0A315Z9S3_SEDFL|nr:SusC/RagA family TonB-linked outer membrane protein [Sediminitomix flava]PWJ41939.1 TonB-linked SusC/RagA family outer membrane protein [Sediminitomix flava]